MKIQNIKDLAEQLAKLRSENKKIVLSCGNFDLLHIGHIRHLEHAKKMGDVLVVAVNPDCRIGNNGCSGFGITEDLRVESVASLSCVDFAAVNEAGGVASALRLLRPHCFAKGLEFEKSVEDAADIAEIEAALKEIGAKVARTEEVDFNSTNHISQYLADFPDEIREYLALMRKRHSADGMLELLRKMQELKVLVIGDTIIDDYHYCNAIGKSSKEPTLALKYQSSDKFAGGIVAVANHVANFAGSVEMATVLGEIDSHEEFIRERLAPGISPLFIRQAGEPTLIKRRFIDGYSLNKLLEVYIMGKSVLPLATETEFCNWLDKNLSRFDLVIAADYGHGAISAKMVDLLVDKAPFLAVNTQANAGNRGFHTVSRYSRADFVCLAEPEMRLEMKDESGDLYPMLEQVGRRMQCRRLVVTRGKKGCLMRDAKGVFCEAPAFAYKVVDRVGAGDAFFSIAAMAGFLGASNEVLGFIGNAAGALAVEIIGNQRAISSASLQENIRSLLQ